MEMLFVRGDGVILVSPLLLSLQAGANCDCVGLTAVKDIAGDRRTCKLTTES